MRVQENRGVVSVCIRVISPSVRCPVMVPFRLLLSTAESDNGAGMFNCVLSFMYIPIYIIICVHLRHGVIECVFYPRMNDVLDLCVERSVNSSSDVLPHLL